jgi:hypothetical protein
MVDWGAWVKGSSKFAGPHKGTSRQPLWSAFPFILRVTQWSGDITFVSDKHAKGLGQEQVPTAKSTTSANGGGCGPWSGRSGPGLTPPVRVHMPVKPVGLAVAH